MALTGVLTPLMPGLQIDFLHDMLNALLSPEHLAKHRDLVNPPKKRSARLCRVNRSWPTGSKSMNSFNKQVDHRHQVVLELAKQQTDRSDLCMQVSNLQLEVEALRVHLAASPLGPPASVPL